MSNQELADLSEFNDLVNGNGQTHAPLRGVVPTMGPMGSDTPQDSNRVMSQNARLWAVSGECYFPCEETESSLPPDHYLIDSGPSGLHFRRQQFKIDDLLELPDCASEKVIAEIRNFWTLEDHFRKYGFLWKRGMMLWGPPGSGKTSTVQIVSSDIVKSGGIAVTITSPHLAIEGLRILRRIEPNRPVVALLEDIDAIVNGYGDAELLALLDGESQIDNVVYIATTNYPERLDKRFINRPSRFDVVQKIGMPSEESRRVYLSHKSIILKEDAEKLDLWVKDTEGFSIAHLKELIISVEVFSAGYKDALFRLKAMMDCRGSSVDFETPTMGLSQAALSFTGGH